MERRMILPLLPLTLVGAVAITAVLSSPGSSTPTTIANDPTGLATATVPTGTAVATEGGLLELSGAMLHFADAETASTLLGTEDDFVRAQSPFDRQVRLASTTPVSSADLLVFAAEQALDWTAEERELVAGAVRTIEDGIDEQGLVFPLPEHIDLVKSTGREEFDFCGYTRGSFVVLAAHCLDGSGKGAVAQLAELLAHELFHVMTRHDPILRDALYATIGFEPLEVPFEAPPEVADLRLTNPDAPVVGHAISLTDDGDVVRFVPVLYSPRRYDGGSVMRYFAPRLLRITGDGTPGRTRDGALDLRTYDGVRGFFERVGRNTDYIIHPEEILADNAALLVLGRRQQVRTPRIVKEMAKLLSAPLPPS